MKTKRYWVVTFFLLVLFVPVISDLIGLSKGSDLNENRHIPGYDQLSLPRKTALYLKNFERTFWGRDYLVKSYIFLKKDVMGISPLPEKVVMGKEGWLYLADYGAMDDYRNVRPFSEAALDSIRQNLTALHDALTKSGIKLYVTVVPDKHTIYPEYLPDFVKQIRPQSRLQQLTAKLRGNVPFKFINLTDTLLASKPTGKLYYSEESHWNDLGAFIGYQKIINAIKKDFPTVNIVAMDSCQVFEGVEKDLDLAKLLGENIDYVEKTQRVVPNTLCVVSEEPHFVAIPPAKRFNPYYAFRKVSNRPYAPEIIIYRDSFFEAVTPFWERSFHRSTYIWTNDVDIDYVKSQSAEILLLEIAERHIDLLAN